MHTIKKLKRTIVFILKLALFASLFGIFFGISLNHGHGVFSFVWWFSLIAAESITPGCSTSPAPLASPW